MQRKCAFLLIVFTFASLTTMMAQDAVVKVHVQPKESFIFVDAQPKGIGTHTLKLTPGQHTISVYNYGFKPMTREVTLAAGKGNDIQEFVLEAAGGPVSGPWGILQIEGAPRAAVLLNGKQPEYFVGHGDEFNHHIIWKQQLIVPAGNHEVTLLYKDKEIWSGKVEVPANKRVIVYANRDGELVLKHWDHGEKMQSAPRFQSGIASTTVAVAPVTGTFSASPKQINCNDKVNLAWNTTETLHRSIASESQNFAQLAISGQETVSPLKTTTYYFKTSGPGGIVETSQTVNVNPVVHATLTPSPDDVHYLRIGDKVIVQDHATLTWNAINADSITMEPFGKVGASGNNTVTPTPKENAEGSINETHSYKLSASNVCGGSDAQVATVRLVGQVEPSISSLFFPTAYPDRGHPNKGLLKSQQERLARIATVFKLYMQHAPDAKLDVVGFADPRGPRASNVSLSARRAAIVKESLIAQGIPAERIVLQIRGANTPTQQDAVKLLEAKNPEPPKSNGANDIKTAQLAYDRRVDVAIMPAAVESARFFPHAASDSALLFDRRWLGEAQIHKASE